TDTIVGVENVIARSSVVDTVVLSGAFEDWMISSSGGTWTATKGSESHALVGVDRLQFSGSTGTFYLVDQDAGGSLFGSIQTAVTAAGNGDTVLVADGTYNENVTIDAGIALRSLGGRDAATIAGVGAGAELGAVVIAGGVNNVRIEGFTIVGL